MPTAQELVDLSTELTDIVKAINAIVGKQALPYDADTANLSNTAFLLASQANAIGQAGLADLANDVPAAIGQLATQVAAANSALKRINNVKAALNLVGVVLIGAASIATSVATGNVGGIGSSVITFANNIKAALSSAPPASGAAGAPAAASAAGGKSGGGG
jgi:hypothetical protein